MYWPNCKAKGGRKPTYLTSATSVFTYLKAVSVVTSGSDKTAVHREDTDVRWVDFHPLKLQVNLTSTKHTSLLWHRHRSEKGAFGKAGAKRGPVLKNFLLL